MKYTDTLLSFFKPLFLLICLCLFTSTLRAGEQNGCKQPSDTCIKEGSWDVSVAIGAGARSNPVVGGDDIPLVLLPSIQYYGKKFFVENFNAGYLLLETQKHEFSALVGPAYEHMFFNQWSIGNFTVGGDPASGPVSASGEFRQQVEVQDGLDNPRNNLLIANQNAEPLEAINLDDLHDRNLALLAGLEYRLYLRSLNVAVQALRDISSVHDGIEVRASAMYEHEVRRHHLAATTGFLWQDAKSLDYYYGVRSDEVSDVRLVYDADSGVSPFVRLDWRYRINKKWTWQNTIHYRHLSDSVKGSPLVDKDSVVSVFVGGVYHF